MREVASDVFLTEVIATPRLQGHFNINPVAKTETTSVYKVALASVSWIPADMRNSRGLPETDNNANWGPETTFDQLVSSDDRDEGRYRFTHILAAQITVDNQTGRIVQAEYLSSDENVRRLYPGLSLARSFLGTKGQRIAHQSDPPVRANGDNKATFRQFAICRTQAPEIIGLDGAFFSTSSAFMSSMAGLIREATVTLLSGLGTLILGQAIAFAPIWTDFVLEMSANGECAFVLEHSCFPSTTLYVCTEGQDFRKWDYLHDGAANQQYEWWLNYGWDYSPKGYVYNEKQRAPSRIPLFARIRRANYHVMRWLAPLLGPKRSKKQKTE